jgi:hypothetical protein
MLRVIGWLGWAGIAALLFSMIAFVIGGAVPPARSDAFLFVAFLAAFLPLLVMIVHLNVRGQQLPEEDRKAWRALLPWGGPFIGCWYLTARDRRVSRKGGIAKLIRMLG